MFIEIVVYLGVRALGKLYVGHALIGLWRRPSSLFLSITHLLHEKDGPRACVSVCERERENEWMKQRKEERETNMEFWMRARERGRLL